MTLYTSTCTYGHVFSSNRSSHEMLLDGHPMTLEQKITLIYANGALDNHMDIIHKMVLRPVVEEQRDRTRPLPISVEESAFSSFPMDMLDNDPFLPDDKDDPFLPDYTDRAAAILSAMAMGLL